MRSRGRLGVPIVVGLLLLAGPALAQQSGLIVGGTGSGFIVSSDGYILMNEHVVRDATKITVYVGDKSYTATVVAVSEANDLALLKIPATGLTAVRLGNSLYVEVLEPVVAMGYPKAGYGRDLTSSTGEITAIRTNVPGREGKDTLQHNATITHGSSGGPLFNRRGEVIGVNFAGDPPLNFAIPINDAIPLLRSVPGFDLRSMGSATSTMTPSQIVAAYRSAVVFIDCTMEISLKELLPSPTSIAGFPRVEEVSNFISWRDWFQGLGFDVLGYAGLSGQPTTFNGFYCTVHVFAFSTAEQATRAARLLLTSDPPPVDGGTFWEIDLGSGKVNIAGLEASYRMVAKNYWFQLLFTYMCSAYVGGRVTWSIGTLVFGVYLSWSASEVGDSIYSSVPCRSTWQWQYESGYLVQVYPSRQRMVSGEEVARRLQQLAELVATTALNRLSK